MQTFAPTACHSPGCPGSAYRHNYCAKHSGEVPRKVRRQAGAHHYRGRWQRLRRIFLSEHPTCDHCAKEGRTRPATQVDHIVPIADGGAVLDVANLQALCIGHHSRKTQREKRK